MANRPDWLAPRSGAIPIIRDAQGVKVVLINTRSNKNNWIFPKGHVEMGMSAQDAAAKEAFEEAGVIGSVSTELFDQYQHQKWGGSMTVKVYLLEVSDLLDSWPEKSLRERQVLPLDEAIASIHAPQKQSLLKLKRVID